MPSRRRFLSALGVASTSLLSYSGTVRGSPPSVPEATWSRTYATKGRYAGIQTIVPVRDGYVLAGNVETQTSQGLVVRTDTAGRVRWQRTVSGSPSIFTAGARHPDDGVVLSGITNINEQVHVREDAPLSSDPWLVRFDENGDLVWRRTLQPTAGSGGISSIAPMADGFLVGGERRVDRAETSRPWVASVSTSGHQRWAKPLTSPDRQGSVNAVAASENALYVGGSTKPTTSDDYGRSEVPFVSSLTADGSVQWTYTVDEPKGARIADLSTDARGIVAVGNRGFSYDDDGQGWHFRLTVAGDVKWRHSHSSGSWNWLEEVTVLDDGYLLVGTRERTADKSSENGPRGAWVLRTGPTGQVQWETTYFDGQHSTGDAVHVLDTDGFLIAGQTGADGNRVGWLMNAGGPKPKDTSDVSISIGKFTDQIPSNADDIAFGAVVGAGTVTALQHVFRDD